MRWLSVNSLVERSDVTSDRQKESSMGIIYILQSLVNSRYYLGSTNDLDRRLEQHNSGRLSLYLVRSFLLLNKLEKLKIG